MVEEALHDGLQVGIDDAGLGAGKDLDERGDLGAEGDVGEA